MATRQLKFDGFMFSELSSAIITINGAERFNGPVGVNQPLNEPIVLCIASYEGLEDESEILDINILVTNGVISIGHIFCNQPIMTPPWELPNLELIDKRTNILINDEPPAWPATTGSFIPHGNQENPNWFGWNFELSTGDTFSCKYVASIVLPAHVKK